ncbi:hypothetical protein ACTFBV_01225 [Aeromonas rivipollensis]
MKILHLCYSDLEGGAARAAYRLHQALRSQGLDSHMLVINKSSDDPHVYTVTALRKLRIKLASFVANLLLRWQKSPTGSTIRLICFHPVCLVRLSGWP